MPTIPPPYTPPNPVSGRAPLPADDTAKGYSSTSVWQVGGQLYTAYDVSNAGAAVWTPGGKVKRGRTADLLGAACVGAWGLVAMKAGFTGPAVDVKCTIAASPVTVTGNILANGELDIAPLMASLALSDAGTTWQVSKLYDQSGGVNHLVQFGSVALPLFLYDKTMGRFVVAAEDKAVQQALSIPVAVSLNPRSHTAVVLGRSMVAGDGFSGILYSLGTYVSGADPCFVIQTTGFGGLQAFGNPTGSTQVFPQPYPLLDNAGSVVIVAGGAGGTTCSVNEMTSSTVSPALPNSAQTGGLIFSDNIATNRYGAMHMVGFALGNTQASAAVQTSIRQSAYVQLGLAPQVRDTVVFIGDSRFSGYLADEQFSIPEGVRFHMKKPCRAFNFGKGSQTMASMNIDTTAQALRYFNTGARNVAVIMGGVNDWIGNNSITVATVLASLQAAVAAMKAAGFKVVVIPELCYSVTAGNTFLTNYRAAIIASQAAGTLGADTVLDVTSYTPVTITGANNFYKDGLHPQQNLNMMLGAVIAPAVDALLS